MSRSALLARRFITLYDMLKFNAARFFNLALTLQVVSSSMDSKPPTENLSSDFKEYLSEEILKTRGYCEELGLSLALMQIDRLVDRLAWHDPQINYLTTVAYLKEISMRIQDELSLQLFMHIPAENAQYFLSPSNVFGPALLDKFPSIIYDVESSCRCYATGNPTATVFHLMRVMESGLRVLGGSLNDPSINPKHNPTWQTMLRKCDEQLQKPLKDRASQWRNDDHFYSEATANLRAVKDAWRNPTMHIEQVYDKEQALAVMNAVRVFMRHLSTKLTE